MSKWKRLVFTFKDVTRAFIEQNQLNEDNYTASWPEVYIQKKQNGSLPITYFAVFRFKSDKSIKLPDISEIPHDFLLEINNDEKNLFIIDKGEYQQTSWKSHLDILEEIEKPDFSYPEILSSEEKQSLYRYYLKEDYPRKTCGDCHYFNTSQVYSSSGCLHPESPIEKSSFNVGKENNKNRTACDLIIEPGTGPEPEKMKACINCEYMVWAVALGLGVFCTKVENRKNNKPFKIPYRYYSCEYYTEKK